MDPVEAEEAQAEPPDEEEEEEEEGFAEKDPTGRFIRYGEIVGSGTVKIVYKAFDKLEGVEVAWSQSQINDSVMGCSQKMEQLNTEVQLLRTLKHKNIVKLFASWIDEEKGVVNIITEYFTSGSLRQYRTKHKKLDMKAMRRWAIQICRFHEKKERPLACSKPLRCPVCVRRSLPPFHEPNVFLAPAAALLTTRRPTACKRTLQRVRKRGGSPTTATAVAATSSRRTMPRSRGSEPPQRASPRAPLHLKTTASSEANGAHHRTSPKVGDRHSPRSPLPEVPQKKRAAGTRVAELETKLGKVQDELKKLREQLASAEAAKKDAQVALEEAKKRVGNKGSPASASTSPLSVPSTGVESAKKTEELKQVPPPAAEEEESSINSPATDVFEVFQAESGNKENQTAAADAADDCEAVSCGEKVALAEKEEVVEEEETKKMIEEESKNAAVETDGAEESPEVTELKAKLAEKDTEIAALTTENAELKKQALDATEAAKKAEEDAAAKASQAEHDLKEAAAREARMGEQLKASEAVREELDGEMRRLRVQTEQWRKAAEAAAAVLGGDNHLTGLAGNGWGSPATMPDGDDDEGFGGKRKGAGIRMLGDLWKKKGNSK